MPLDNERDTQLLETLLDFDLKSFAAFLGYLAPPKPLSDVTAAALLNLAERCSRKADDESRQICLTICGLITEYRKAEWTAAPAFVVNLLSRIGLAPSMRMADPAYQRKTDSFSPLGSYLTELRVAARCMHREVLASGKRRLQFSDFQHRVWRLINENQRIGISAPTSAGKSYVLVYKVLDTLHELPGTAVFVVPTISLIHQVTRDLRAAAADLGMSDVGVYHSHLEDVSRRHSSTVFVLTQERAFSAFSQPTALKGCRIVIIDEVQNLERVSQQDDERAHLLLDVIHEFDTARDAEKIVISGPRVENIGQLTKTLFGPTAVTTSAGLPPVVNVTYTFADVTSRKKKQVLLKQYVDVSNRARSVELIDADVLRSKIFKKQAYNDGTHDILGNLLKSLAEQHGTLIFSPTPEQATTTTIEIGKRVGLVVDSTTKSLSDYLAETVHENYPLVQTVAKGIAFHHGKMPQHTRIAVEHAFSSQQIKAIVCTTTLMQGINLPAKYLIARNPNLFVKRGANSSTLTPYEFSNLRGRAGRLLKDFVGRSIVLDESFFPSVGEYVGSPGKNVNSGYGSRFEESREEIIGQLLTDDTVSQEQIAADLISYIRYTIFRYRERGLERLQRVGISITDDEFNKILSIVSSLSVPQEVVERNPSWDPIDLERLFRANKSGNLPEVPNSPYSAGFVQRIVDTLGVLQTLTPRYINRYLGDVTVKYLQALAISAQSWSTETPLKEIVDYAKQRRDLPWQEIDKRLALLLGPVVYCLPKLLRPVAMIQSLSNPMLGFVEVGAFRPNTRRLIELGLARETAIRCVSKFSRPLDASTDDETLVAATAVAAEQLTEWDRLQVIELGGTVKL